MPRKRSGKFCVRVLITGPEVSALHEFSFRSRKGLAVALDNAGSFAVQVANALEVPR